MNGLSLTTAAQRLAATAMTLAAAAILLLTALFGAPAHADITPADLAGQPPIMKQDCRNRLGRAGESLCQTDAAYVQCLAYLKAGHWDYCLRSGDAESQARRSTAVAARTRLLNTGCVELGNGQFRCPDTDFNLSLAYVDCVAFRNGGSVGTCLRRDFLSEYADRVDARLRLNPSVGYAFSVINRAGDRIDRAYGVARKAPDAYPAAMTATAPYPIASVSKNIAAAATLRALALRGLSPGTPVYTYLPNDWKLSNAFKSVTFGDLLRHRSGLYNDAGVRCDEVQKSVSFSAVKACAESVNTRQFVNSDCKKNPIADAGAIGCYQNLDYAFLRIAVPMLDESLKAAKLAGPMGSDDRARLYATLYEQFVNTNVFVPAGFTAQCKPVLGVHEPLVYNTTVPAAGGTDFGDGSLSCGGEGWVLSAPQLAQYLHALDGGTIIPPAQVQSMKDSLFGWEATVAAATPFGTITRWWHGGCYNSDGQGLCNLSTLVMSFSNGVQLTAVFNSDFKNGRTYGADTTDPFFEVMK